MTRFALVAALVLLAGCSKPADDAWQGYIEGEYVMLASPAAGQLQKLYVQRGQQVEAGKPAFALEQESERAARQQAEEQLKSAQARLENLRSGRRAPEVETLRAAVTEDLTIRENLEFVARMYGMKQRKAEVAAALEQLGLAERRDQLAGTLSGGWKQRLALAACMLHRPRLLLLDEPTAGVDPQARRDFWEEIHVLAAGGISVLVSTHYMDEAERCHRLAYIAYGDLLATGTPDEILHLYPLYTWAVSGTPADLARLAPALHGRAGISHVTAFGNTLHITGGDEAALEHAIAEFRSDPAFDWRRSQASLEDVFIHLMPRNGDRP